MKRKMIKDLELETNEGLQLIIAEMDKLIDAQEKGILNEAVVYGKEEKPGEQESPYQIKRRALKILKTRRSK